MDKETLHILITKYFDAETSIEEERMLLKEVLSLEGKDPKADEVLAVMGYAHIKPEIRSKTVGIPKLWKIAGIAAVVAAVGIGGFSYMSTNAIENGNECYAYIDGVRIENQIEISSLIRQQLGEVSEAGESVEDAISSDLEDMGDAFNFETL